MPAASVADIAKGFRQSKFEMGQIHYSGGLLTKAMPVATKKITASGRTHTFCKFNVNQPWLLGAVTGQRTKGFLDRTSLLDTLLKFVEKASNGEIETLEPPDGEYDPMQEIDVSDEDHPRSRGRGTPPSAKRARFYKNHAKNRMLTVAAPAISPEEDPQSTQTREITLYVVGRKQVWLHLDDVDWAVRYLFMQYSLKGVPVVPADSMGPQHDSSEAGSP